VRREEVGKGMLPIEKKEKEIKLAHRWVDRMCHLSGTREYPRK
jgi:hypothetical protein